MLEEFKKFALRGNVVDLAVGVIIGAAFGAIVTSLVGDVIMPIIGAITGGLDFSNYYLPLSAKGAGWPFLCRCEKTGRRARVGPVFDCGHKLSDHCVGLVPSDQGHKQIEKGGISCACPRAHTRSKTAHRNS